MNVNLDAQVWVSVLRVLCLFLHGWGSEGGGLLIHSLVAKIDFLCFESLDFDSSSISQVNNSYLDR